VPAAAPAVGDLLVFPTRFIFDMKKRSAEVTVINIGKTTATYRISLIHERMSESGTMTDITTPAPGELFVDELVRFTPRQVILDPHVAQVIRIQLRKPENLASGEYRSHMLFRAVPKAEAVDPAQKPDGNTLGIHLTPIYGVSIPLIVRHQTTAATTALSEATVSQTTTPEHQWKASLRLNRSGDESTYGDLLVTLSGGSHAGEVVGKLGGVAVYTPNKSRTVSIDLHLPQGVTTLSGRRLLINYQQKSEDGGATLAQTTVDVP